MRSGTAIPCAMGLLTGQILGSQQKSTPGRADARRRRPEIGPIPEVASESPTAGASSSLADGTEKWQHKRTAMTWGIVSKDLGSFGPRETRSICLTAFDIYCSRLNQIACQRVTRKSIPQLRKYQQHRYTRSRLLVTGSSMVLTILLSRRWLSALHSSSDYWSVSSGLASEAQLRALSLRALRPTF